jgi:RNA polymerase sigma-70 factor (ECF subfamily)
VRSAISKLVDIVVLSSSSLGGASGVSQYLICLKDVAPHDFLHGNLHYLVDAMDARTSLIIDAFSARCRPFGAGGDEVAALLIERIDAARAAWPSIDLDLVEFAAHLATRLDEHEDPLVGLAHLRVPDLYLAFAAARRAPSAIEAFEAALLSRVPSFVSRIDPSPAFVDEVQQALRIKLLVEPKGKLAQYSGHGSLEGWFRAVAIRTAYDLRRAEIRRHAQQDEDVRLIAASIDIEVDLLRARYKGEFRAALQEAIASLNARQRTLLRLYFLERLTTTQIGRIYRVHETTALRWIAAARQAIVADIRGSLERKLRVSKADFDDLIGVVQSQLDMSFSRILDVSGHAASHSDHHH